MRTREEEKEKEEEEEEDCIIYLVDRWLFLPAAAAEVVHMVLC